MRKDNHDNKKLVLRLIFICVVSSFQAHANAGLPMIVIAWPAFWGALIPIIFIEFFVMKRKISLLNEKHLFRKVLIANLVSTFIGIPFAWLITLFIQLMVPGGTGTFPELNDIWRYILGVSVQAAWLIPYEKQFYWMIPTAFLILLGPFFIVSYWIEYKVIKVLLKKEKISDAKIKESVWVSNIYSYMFLALISILYILVALTVRW